MPEINGGLGHKIEMLAKKLWSSVAGSATRLLRGFFTSTVTDDRKEFNSSVADGTFVLLDEIDKSKKNITTSVELRKWLEPKFKDNSWTAPMIQGRMYYFAYPNPLTAEELEFYDPTPLIICFSVGIAGTGNFIEKGINLHYLPFKIRCLVLDEIFNLFKAKYRSQMFSEEKRPLNEFNYKELQAIIDKYHIDFAVRSYIPKLRKGTLMLDYMDWPTAILIETAGFKGITQAQLEQLYKKYVSDKLQKQTF